MLEWTYEESREFPVFVGFDAIGSFFAVGDAPTGSEMEEAMQQADYNSYIQNYVWNSEPAMENVFYEVTSVAFSAAVPE